MKRRERTRNIHVRVERFWILWVLYLPFEMTATHPFSVVYFFFYFLVNFWLHIFSVVLGVSQWRLVNCPLVLRKKTKRSTRKSGNAWCCCCWLLNCSAMFVTFKLFTLGHTWCREGSKTYSLFSGNFCHIFFGLTICCWFWKDSRLGSVVRPHIFSICSLSTTFNEHCGNRQ